jgi:hypothetical protein
MRAEAGLRHVCQHGLCQFVEAELELAWPGRTADRIGRAAQVPPEFRVLRKLFDSLHRFEARFRLASSRRAAALGKPVRPGLSDRAQQGRTVDPIFEPARIVSMASGTKPGSGSGGPRRRTGSWLRMPACSRHHRCILFEAPGLLFR